MNTSLFIDLQIDFDQWFTTTLTQELKVRHNNYRVIRRRVLLLIGNWTGIKLSRELRPMLYDSIAQSLIHDEDMAVRLTASTSLRYAIDDFEFNSEQFRPYLDSCFTLLFDLLKEAKECETKVLKCNKMMNIKIVLTFDPYDFEMKVVVWKSGSICVSWSFYDNFYRVFGRCTFLTWWLSSLNGLVKQ